MTPRLLALLFLSGLAFQVKSDKSSGVWKKSDGLIGYEERQSDYREQMQQDAAVATPPRIPKVLKMGCGSKRVAKSRSIIPSIYERVSGSAKKTFYGEVPWMARIYKNGEFVGGGTLISNKVVLTAAHRIKSASPSELEVEVGEWDSSITSEPISPQRQKALRVNCHSEFDIDNSANNIAVIVMREEFVFSETVGVVCLPKRINYVNTSACLATGWGKAEMGKMYAYTSVLHKVLLPVMERDKCQEHLRQTALGDRFELRPEFICAGGTDERDTCQGDGGGPLYCPTIDDPDRFAIIGVIAWGMDCGKTNPTVLTSVPYFYDWITKQLE